MNPDPTGSTSLKKTEKKNAKETGKLQLKVRRKKNERKVKVNRKRINCKIIPDNTILPVQRFQDDIQNLCYIKILDILFNLEYRVIEN